MEADAAPKTIHLTLNYQPVAAAVAPETTLFDFLRSAMSLTLTRLSCGAGRCGACCVRIDGRLDTACIVPMGSLEGREVVTLEAPGMTPGELLFGSWPVKDV